MSDGVEIEGTPSDHFTIVANAALYDDRLSLKAKGLLCYLGSHRSGYKVSQSQMLRQHADGRDSLLSGLAELEANGYLERRPSERIGGRYTVGGYVLRWSGRPTETAPNPSGGPTVSGNPTRVSRHGSPEKDKTIGQDEPPTEVQGQLPLTRHLAAVGGSEEPTSREQQAERKQRLGSVAAALAKEHCDALHGLPNYLAMLGVVKKVLDAVPGGGGYVKTGAPPIYTREQVRAGLAALREVGRTPTVPGLVAAIDRGNGARTVAGGGYRPGRPEPYRDPDPAAHPHAFEGPL